MNRRKFLSSPTAPVAPVFGSRSSTDVESQWLGFASIAPEERSERIRTLFDEVAVHYDFMNDLMSLGLHRLWKDTLIDRIGPCSSQKLLDVAGGTGDIALRFVSRGGGRVYVCDMTESMLRIGREKASHHKIDSIDWILGNAEHLPIATRSIDIYTIAFGLRNVSYIDKALKEAYRVLKRGGRFFCLEFSRPRLALLRRLYEIYELNVLPFLGYVGTGQTFPYRYLGESICTFMDQETLSNRMRDVGFSQVHWRPLGGGVVSIHSGWSL